VNHPEGDDTEEHSGEAIEDKNPRPAPLSPTQFIFSMAAASSPPKEPATAAALKKMAARIPNSERLYQQDKQWLTPGKRPASAMPRNQRAAIRPEKLCTKAHGCHDDAPEDHDYRDENGWSEAFEQNLCQGLKSGVRDEEDRQGQVVLRAGQFQIRAEARDFGIADVGTIQERRKVEQTEPWYQLQVEFPEEFAIRQYG
jgi:hypothetical protein